MRLLTILLLFPLLMQGQTRPILFEDDCEGNKLTSFVGGRCEVSNAYVSNGWTGYQGYNTAGSITKSSTYSRKGTYSYLFKLNGGRPTGNWQDQKAELSWNFYPAGTPLGLNGCNAAFNKPLLGIRWMAGSSYIPVETTLPSDPNLRISFLFNVKSAPDAPATSSFVEINNGRYRIANTVPTAGGGSRITLYDAGPVVKGVWVDWVLERNYSTGNDGYVRWYKNGQLVSLNGQTTLTGPNWFPNISKEPYIQNGLYRFAALPNDFIIFLDEFRFGDANATLQQMMPSATVIPNQPPNATITPDVVTTQSTTAQVIASVTDDGTITDRNWTFISGPNTPSQTGTQGDTLRASSLNNDGEYVFRFIATDNGGLKDTAFVTIVRATDRTVIFFNGAELETDPPQGGINANIEQFFSGNSGDNRNTIVRNTDIKRTGIASYKFTVLDTTAVGWQYNGKELVYNFQPAVSSFGITWQGVSIYPPLSMQGDGTATTVGINALRLNSETKAHWLEIRNGRWYFYHTLWTASGTYAGLRVADVGEVEYGKWVDWALNRNYTSASTGYIRLYRNKFQVYSFNGTNYSSVGTRPEPYFHIGIWKPALDSAGNNKSTIEFNIDNIAFGGSLATVDDISPNQAPTSIIDPLPDTELDTVIIRAKTADIDGTIVSRSWLRLSGPSATIIGSSDTVQAVLTDTGTYVFQQIVTDDQQAVGSANVTVVKVADPVPVPPTVSLPTSIQYRNDTVTVTATATGSGLTYEWFMDNSPSNARPNLANANTATVTVTGHKPGMYNLRIIVTDSAGQTAEGVYAYAYRPLPSFFFIYSGKVNLILK